MMSTNENSQTQIPLGHRSNNSELPPTPAFNPAQLEKKTLEKISPLLSSEENKNSQDVVMQNESNFNQIHQREAIKHTIHANSPPDSYSKQSNQDMSFNQLMVRVFLLNSNIE